MTKTNTEIALKTRRLEEIRHSIIGLPLIRAYRAADMRMFHFGRSREYKGGKVADWSLNVLCSWRLLGPDKIITGYQDLWRPIKEIDWNENWDYESGNLQDDKLLQFFNSAKKQYLVEDIIIKNCGDLEIHLSGGYKIETFLNHSLGESEESWLIFQPGDLDSFFHMDADSSKAYLFSAKEKN